MTRTALNARGEADRGAPESVQPPSHGAASTFSDLVRDLTENRPALTTVIGLALVALIACGCGWTFQHTHLM